MDEGAALSEGKILSHIGCLNWIFQHLQQKLGI